MVEYRRNALREDGAHLPAAHPGSVMGGTPASHSSRHCGNQRRTGGSPLEEVRCFDCSSYAYSLMKHYTSTRSGTLANSFSPEDTATRSRSKDRLTSGQAQ